MHPLRREELPELETLFAHYDRTLGFVPNSLFTMARRPEILEAFSELITQIWNTGTLPTELKPLIAIVSSVAAGCRYCQAHEAVDARERGIDDDKIAEIWNFERSDRYSDAERAALRFARDASLVPNEVKRRTSMSCDAIGATARSWRCCRWWGCSASSTDGTTPWRPSSNRSPSGSRRRGTASAGSPASTHEPRASVPLSQWNGR
jgi:AhpD family alkylhydroperoxidase